MLQLPVAVVPGLRHKNAAGNGIDADGAPAGSKINIPAGQTCGEKEIQHLCHVLAEGAILQGKDLVIFEATEQQIRGAHKTAGMSWQEAANNGHLGHNAVYDSLYEYLKAHEGEY